MFLSTPSDTGSLSAVAGCVSGSDNSCGRGISLIIVLTGALIFGVRSGRISAVFPGGIAGRERAGFGSIVCCGMFFFIWGRFSNTAIGFIFRGAKNMVTRRFVRLPAALFNGQPASKEIAAAWMASDSNRATAIRLLIDISLQ